MHSTCMSALHGAKLGECARDLAAGSAGGPQARGWNLILL